MHVPRATDSIGGALGQRYLKALPPYIQRNVDPILGPVSLWAPDTIPVCPPVGGLEWSYSNQSFLRWKNGFCIRKNDVAIQLHLMRGRQSNTIFKGNVQLILNFDKYINITHTLPLPIITAVFEAIISILQKTFFIHVSHRMYIHACHFKEFIAHSKR